MTKWLKENRGFLLFLIGFAFVRTAVADWNPVPTGSMKPTILEGDVVLVNRLAFDAKIPLTDVSVAHLGDPPAWMVETMRTADPLALAALAEALPRRSGVLPRLAEIDTPVLLIAGGEDSGLPDIRRTADILPNGRLVVLPGCGHFEAFVRSDLALAAVLDGP